MSLEYTIKVSVLLSIQKCHTCHVQIFMRGQNLSVFFTNHNKTHFTRSIHRKISETLSGKNHIFSSGGKNITAITGKKSFKTLTEMLDVL